MAVDLNALFEQGLNITQKIAQKNMYQKSAKTAFFGLKTEKKFKLLKTTF